LHLFIIPYYIRNYNAPGFRYAKNGYIPFSFTLEKTPHFIILINYDFFCFSTFETLSITTRLLRLERTDPFTD